MLVWKRKNTSPFRSSLESSHKMEMKYSDKGTLVRRQRYPLLSFTAVLTHEPLHNLRRSVFENIFDNCFVTICHFWFQNIFDNFCHFWFENMFDNCFVIICHLSPYLHKSFLISWQNLFMKHFKFVSWQSGGSAPQPPPGLRHGPPRLPHPSRPPSHASNN